MKSSERKRTEPSFWQLCLDKKKSLFLSSHYLNSLWISYFIPSLFDVSFTSYGWKALLTSKTPSCLKKAFEKWSYQALLQILGTSLSDIWQSCQSFLPLGTLYRYINDFYILTIRYTCIIFGRKKFLFTR